jgi:TRAP-type mannitol/chloroaromatic compound transport system permease large subunit
VTRRVSIQEVADRAGVSAATVSNALNRPHLVSAQSREVVEEAVRELRYVRNGVARQLRLGQSPVVGMVVWTLTNPFLAHLADATETEAEKLGLHVVVGVRVDEVGIAAVWVVLRVVAVVMLLVVPVVALIILVLGQAVVLWESRGRAGGREVVGAVGVVLVAAVRKRVPLVDAVVLVRCETILSCRSVSGRVLRRGCEGTSDE